MYWSYDDMGISLQFIFILCLSKRFRQDGMVSNTAGLDGVHIRRERQ